jgi:hypothetical protein
MSAAVLASPAINPALPKNVGVAKVVQQYSSEYPDDPRIKRIIHVLTNGEEVVVFDAGLA